MNKSYPAHPTKYLNLSSKAQSRTLLEHLCQILCLYQDLKARGSETLERGAPENTQKLKEYQNSSLFHEIDVNSMEDIMFSTCRFLDGSEILLPKHSVKVVDSKYHIFDISKGMAGIWRYLRNLQGHSS